MKLTVHSLLFSAALSTVLTVFAQEFHVIGSRDDIWDVSRGTAITRNSPLDSASGDPNSYDARDIFGGDFGNFRPERQVVIFSDETPPGSVNFVEWRTQSPVTIRSFRLYAGADDDRLHRGIAQFRLLAKAQGAVGFNIVLHEFKTTLPAVALDQAFLLIQADTRTVTASEFRAEFISRTGLNGNHGPRIIELDGFADSIETRSSIRMSEVEICWDSTTGVRYRVEYKSQLPDSNWVTVGPDARDGTGSRMCVQDRLPQGSETRFYRVRRLE